MKTIIPPALCLFRPALCFMGMSQDKRDKPSRPNGECDALPVSATERQCAFGQAT